MNKFFKHPIFISVLTAVLSAIVTTPIVAYIKSQTFIQAFKTILSAVWWFIKVVLTFGIPVWVLLLIIGLFFLMIFILSKKPVQHVKPDFTSYTEDNIEGIHWEWEWYQTYSGKYDLSSNSPVPTCSSCKGFLVLGHHLYGGNHLVCENCKVEKKLNDWSLEEYLERIKREIYRRVKAEEWNN
ncbi:hypothetical protein [Paenibacillus odorifer]|uniref:hypothetical protein n=1 Tax=Paenibacillus odorifer TaxID=189426 RepID=UPI00096D8BA8|nr:hypothetical protein [Paenibacillus odorifer]OME41440.1 hypothetical protein BSK58_15020 [Paenibacillus odorifer]